MDEINEKHIETALIKGTDDVVKLKAYTWDNIEEKLKSQEKSEVQEKLNNQKGKISIMGKRKSILKYGSIAAALLMVLLITNGQYVSAAVDKIRDLFAPSKTIQQSLEGTTENTQVDLQVSSQHYVLYIDKNMYSTETVNGKDIITPKNKAENLPPISMTIEQKSDKSVSTAISELEKELQANFKTVNVVGQVTEPLKAYCIVASSGSKWNDTVVKYYIVDNTKGGSYIIKQQYFMEAEEGHGARFDNMLKEFKIVSE